MQRRARRSAATVPSAAGAGAGEGRTGALARVKHRTGTETALGYIFSRDIKVRSLMAYMFMEGRAVVAIGVGIREALAAAKQVACPLGPNLAKLSDEQLSSLDGFLFICDENVESTWKDLSIQAWEWWVGLGGARLRQSRGCSDEIGAKPRHSEFGAFTKAMSRAGFVRRQLPGERGNTAVAFISYELHRNTKPPRRVTDTARASPRRSPSPRGEDDMRNEEPSGAPNDDVALPAGRAQLTRKPVMRKLVAVKRSRDEEAPPSDRRHRPRQCSPEGLSPRVESPALLGPDAGTPIDWEDMTVSFVDLPALGSVLRPDVAKPTPTSPASGILPSCEPPAGPVSAEEVFSLGCPMAPAPEVPPETASAAAAGRLGLVSLFERAARESRAYRRLYERDAESASARLTPGAEPAPFELMRSVSLSSTRSLVTDTWDPTLSMVV